MANCPSRSPRRSFVNLLATAAETLRGDLRNTTYAANEADLPAGLRATDDQMAVTRIDSLDLGSVPTSWAGVSPRLPRTFVRPLRDRLYPHDAQQRLAAAIRS